MEKEFEMNMMKEMTFFLGLQVKQKKVESSYKEFYAFMIHIKHKGKFTCIIIHTIHAR